MLHGVYMGDLSGQIMNVVSPNKLTTMIMDSLAWSVIILEHPYCFWDMPSPKRTENDHHMAAYSDCLSCPESIVFVFESKGDAEPDVILRWQEFRIGLAPAISDSCCSLYMGLINRTRVGPSFIIVISARDHHSSFGNDSSTQMLLDLIIPQM
ncbi:hypothetical protein AVEN_269839-1 [Araneus ventricosus]|uniref:Uncharacterized protein n=1 Tax=Araneus ventricosus TaxID=182803 RepID=A0A4Y2CFA8_ARAVE|nr:hypothetical protein AVEN_269839-1 [Araneus ventricosus]